MGFFIFDILERCEKYVQPFPFRSLFLKEGAGLSFSDYFKYKLRQKLQFHLKIPSTKTPKTMHGLQSHGAHQVFRKIKITEDDPQNSCELFSKASIRVSS
jgi:hypothetical protein